MEHAAFSNLHLVLQNSHVSLFHQLVERHEFSKALSHSHDLSLSGQVQRQLQSRVERHLPDTAATQQASSQHLGASWVTLDIWTFHFIRCDAGQTVPLIFKPT